MIRPAALQELPGDPRVRSDRDKECADLLPLPLGSTPRESSCAQGGILWLLDGRKGLYAWPPGRPSATSRG